MDSLEERLSKLEKQVRVYRVLTIAMIAILVLIFGWVGYGVWRLMGVQQLIGPPIEARGITLLDGKGHPHASLAVTEAGWVLHMLPDTTITAEPATRSVGGVPPHGARLEFNVSGGSPVLTMTDKAGKEVWHAP